jgi:3-hydroxyisobutyrate dehydrogenase-like beta-hydroxyacid dehydrogenase
MRVGIIHPGSMGAALATALAGTQEVLWAGVGRSQETTRRAESASLADVSDLRELAEQSDVIVSACPPSAAVDVAGQVARVRADGLLYIDANSVAPQTLRRIAGMFGPGVVVDAAVTGSPRLDLGATTLWLSGPRAAEAAALFAGSLVATRVVGDQVGQASAVKMCAGLRSKVIPAVWATLIDAARAYGPEVEESVRDHLADIGHDMSEQEAKLAERAPKAWRWTGEMDEAAKAMAEVGMPTGFSAAASETYRRIAEAR